MVCLVGRKAVVGRLAVDYLYFLSVPFSHYCLICVYCHRQWLVIHAIWYLDRTDVIPPSQRVGRGIEELA